MVALITPGTGTIRGKEAIVPVVDVMGGTFRTCGQRVVGLVIVGGRSGTARMVGTGFTVAATVASTVLSTTKVEVEPAARMPVVGCPLEPSDVISAVYVGGRTVARDFRQDGGTITVSVSEKVNCQTTCSVCLGANSAVIVGSATTSKAP